MKKGQSMAVLNGCVVILKKDGTLTKKSKKKYKRFKKARKEYMDTYR